MGQVSFIKSLRSEVVSVSSPTSSIGLVEDSKLSKELLKHRVFRGPESPSEGITGRDGISWAPAGSWHQQTF